MALTFATDQGFVVLTGCGHAGIVNIVRSARRLTGVDQVLLVTGGLHLRDGPVVAASVAALARERPQLVVPGHCTSWQAHHALQQAMPHAYRPNSVGCRLELSATADARPANGK
jgi:7,8-dihydropterin-6-yl-methyl-4-(beta-D-ribofuranosyl)aminobenzene 5'-phosphate synthase